MTIEFSIGDDVWYGTYSSRSGHIGTIQQILVDKDGVRYRVSGSNEYHSLVYRTEKELCVASLKQDISYHENCIKQLNEQLKELEGEDRSLVASAREDTVKDNLVYECRVCGKPCILSYEEENPQCIPQSGCPFKEEPNAEWVRVE